MANPRIAQRPIILIEPDSAQWRVSVWSPPSGIWRKTGEDDLAPNLERARNIASALAMSTGGFVAIDPVQK